MLLLLDFGVEVLLCCSESVGVLEDWSSSEESALSVLGSGSFVPFLFQQCCYLLRVRFRFKDFESVLVDGGKDSFIDAFNDLLEVLTKGKLEGLRKICNTRGVFQGHFWWPFLGGQEHMTFGGKFLIFIEPSSCFSKVRWWRHLKVSISSSFL